MTNRETAAYGFASFPHKCQPGTARALAWTMEFFDVASDGCLNEDSHLSGGGWSWHKYGKAYDVAIDWYNKDAAKKGELIFSFVLANAELWGLQQMIAGHKIVDIRDGYKVREYKPDDHMNHVHIAMSYAASLRWQAPVTIAPRPKEQTMFIVGVTSDGTAKGVPGPKYLVNDSFQRRHLKTKEVIGFYVALLDAYHMDSHIEPINASQAEALPWMPGFNADN